MILCFELSMPSNNSWNGRWSGEERNYCKVINFGRTKNSEHKAKAILNQGYFVYSFGDGWPPDRD